MHANCTGQWTVVFTNCFQWLGLRDFPKPWSGGGGGGGREGGIVLLVDVLFFVTFSVADCVSAEFFLCTQE